MGFNFVLFDRWFLRLAFYLRNILQGKRKMSYIIYDEDGQLMRTVSRQEEAVAVCAFRPGWTFKRVSKPRVRLDLSHLGEALFWTQMN